MSNDGFRALGAKRKDHLLIDPDELVIVTDPAHELYDKRAFQPLDPAFKALIKKYHVKVPVQIRYNGKDENGKPIAEVVDGRQRVRAAREINEEEGWTGDDKIMVPAVLWRGTQTEATASMVMLNEGRRNDDVLTKAENAKRLLNRGMTIEDVALVFTRSVATIERWMSLFDCSDEVRKAVEHEGMTVEAALKLANLPMAEQTKALADLREKGELVGQAAVAAAEEKATRGKPKKKQKRARPYKEIEAKRRALLKKWKNPTKYQQGIIDGICFALGDELEGDEK